jgi:hypothetical protein
MFRSKSSDEGAESPFAPIAQQASMVIIIP